MTKLVMRTGRIVDLVNLSGDMFCVHDIAWSLAHEVRWNGCLGALSVAQHSFKVMQLLEKHGPVVQLLGLLHDASEAYLGDTALPVKTALAYVSGDSHSTLEGNTQYTIEVALVGREADSYERKIIGAADKLCAKVEAKTFGKAHWKDAIRSVAPDYFRFEDTTTVMVYNDGLWSADVAADRFLNAYEALKTKIDNAQ